MNEIESVCSLLDGIGDETLRSSSLCKFCQNIALICVRKGMIELSARYLMRAEDVDRTEKSKDMLDSLYLMKRETNDNLNSDFIKIWENHITQRYDDVLKLSGEMKDSNYLSYLKGFASMKKKNYHFAIKCFSKSIKLGFRITDSYNCLGICNFYMKNIRESINAFENGIKLSINCIEPLVFNLAEILGTIGKFDQQMDLLQFYCRLLKSKNNGSLSTLYKIAKITLKEGNYRDAIDKYQYILDEAVNNGNDLPSSTFASEYAYALNMIGDYKTAQKIFKCPDSPSYFEITVTAHSLWLENKFEECFNMIKNLETSDSLSNKAILYYLSGNFKEAFMLSNKARQLEPDNLKIIRNSVLIQLSRQQNIRSGCLIWLTALHYQTDRDEEYYEDLKNVLSTSGLTDKLTICVLQNWKEIINKRNSMK